LTHHTRENQHLISHSGAGGAPPRPHYGEWPLAPEGVIAPQVVTCTGSPVMLVCARIPSPRHVALNGSGST